MVGVLVWVLGEVRVVELGGVHDQHRTVTPERPVERILVQYGHLIRVLAGQKQRHLDGMFVPAIFVKTAIRLVLATQKGRIWSTQSLTQRSRITPVPSPNHPPHRSLSNQTLQYIHIQIHLTKQR